MRHHRGDSLTRWLKKYSTAKPTRTKAQKDDRFRRGRQIAHMIYEYFRVTGTDACVRDFSDFVNATSRGNDIQGFDTRRDEVSLSIKETPHDHIPESVYNMRIQGSEKLKTVFALYDQDLEHKEKLPSYTRLTKMVKKILEPKNEREISRPETTEPRVEHRPTKRRWRNQKW